MQKQVGANPRQSAASSTWRWLRITCMVGGIGFIVWLLWRLLRDPDFLNHHLVVSGFVGAVALGVFANAMVGMIFSDLVAKSVHIDFDKRISAYYFSQIAKYVPGRIAALLVQKSILSGPRALSATIISNLELMAICSALCTGAALALLVASRSLAGAAVIAAVSIGVGVLLIRINWAPLLRCAQRVIPRYRFSSELHPTQRIGRTRAAILSTSVLVLPATSNYVLLTDGINIPHGMAIPLTALLLLSWVGGMIAFVFPAGIGIRELIFFLLGGALWHAPGAELMAGIAVSARLTQVLTDIVGVLLFLAVRRLWRFANGQRK